MSYDATVMTDEEREELHWTEVWKPNVGGEVFGVNDPEFNLTNQLPYLNRSIPALPKTIGMKPIHVERADMLVRVMEYRGVSDGEIRAWIDTLLKGRRKAA